MTVEIIISRGRPTQTDIAFFGVIDVDARPGHPLTVRLVVEDGEERRYTLEPGDTFRVRDELWALDRVEDPDDDWLVFIRKVEQQSEETP
ncbi:DUF6406 domain-containing protein [Embleya sp. NBC_00896]|uniref:DUF6406 domain-containing protein n=1 Tax=Embleya sp. NBC_00896 TaxID=2975961 RepID=UPI002F90D0FE|nr:hypothetical protein OG928_36085 [Embleya sp. NBC_00896]